MRFYICLFLSLLVNGAFSQALVRGTVQDKEGVPVDCFNALILSAADSVFIDGAACFNGSLSVGTKATSEVLLKITALGYEDLTRPLSLQDGRTEEVGTLTLTPASETIDEVVVTARRPAIISKPDRMVVSVEGSLLSSAADGVEMLRKTPGLTVDRNGSVGVFGKGAAVIYLDNRPVRSSAEIKMLNPQNIKSIEIIDNPPPAYDAQGNAVILIHTVKSQDHYSVRLGGMLSQSRRTSAGGFAEGHWAKNRFSASLYYAYNDDRSESGEYGYISPDDIYRIFHKTKELFHDRSQEGYLSLSYAPASGHTLGLQTTGYHSRGTSDGRNRSWSDDPALHAFETFAREKSRSWSVGQSLYYDWQIDTLGQKFAVVGDYFRSDSKSIHPYYNVPEGVPVPETPFVNTNDNAGTNSLLSVRADYVKPIGKVWRVETGMKYYRIENENSTVQTGSTNSVQDYSSTEWNVAGYVSLTARVSDKIELRGGLRTEYNDRKARNNGERYADRSALDWFPSFLLKYDASDNVGIGLSYTKRLNRPSLYELDPTLVSADSLMTRKGNPDLKSEKSHVFQLTFGLWQDFNIRFGYNLNINPTYFTVVRDEENPYMHNVRYVNEPKSRSFVVSASYNKDVCRWWTTSVYVGLSGSEYKYVGTDGIRRNNNMPYWVLYTTHTFTLPGKLMWDVGFNWTSAGSRGTYYSGSYWNLYTSLRRDFLDGALSCRITANDLFRRSQGYQRSVLPGGNWNLFNADDRYVRLSVTYKFGKSKHQYQSKSGSSTEISRMQ